MNIFYTDYNPANAAQSLPDKLVVKMPVETVQMLVSVLMRYDTPHSVTTVAGAKHRGGYHRHPSTVWAGDSSSNASWLFDHGVALCQEYRHRYGRVHACYQQLADACKALLVTKFDADKPTNIALAMPDELKQANAVQAYRDYIRHKVATKPTSFVWQRNRAQPVWL